MASNPEGTELPDVAAVEARAASMSRAAVVSSTSPKLTNGQRRHLRGLGHHLRPVVQIGHHGLTEGLVTALDKALETHELVKVKALETCPVDREVAALWLHEATGAAVVQVLGRTLLVYRARPKDPTIRLPR